MSDRVEQAGAIVVRRSGGALEVLLVRGSRPPHPWVFPKGHIEPGETAAETATRELREEAGVIGSVFDWVGDTEFVDKNRTCHVSYYLFQPTSTKSGHEPRAQRWVRAEQALELLDFEESRRLLTVALSLFRSRSSDLT